MDEVNRWILAGILVLVLGFGAVLYFRPSIIPGINPAHEERAAADVKDVEQKDMAIRNLSAEIERLRKVAEVQGQARAAAEQRANAFAERAKELGTQLARIEAERKAQVRVTTVQQVREALARRGIVAR